MYVNAENKCCQLLANYLKKGSLGLVLGAGASKAIGLPGWQQLIEKCLKELSLDVPDKEHRETNELKKIAEKIKKNCGSDEKYLQLVKDQLYKDVTFDFRLAKIDILVALTSLMVGKVRGNVSSILTYNFDSVLEWYLRTNGLKVNVTKKQDLTHQFCDVEVTHLHGYLPHDEQLGLSTDFLIFTKKEFEDRQIQYDYWKEFMYEFFRRNIFLAIGLSPQSIIDDLCPYLRSMNAWYKSEKILRNHPYGIAFIPNNELNEDDKQQMIEDGIIPCGFDDYKDIPSAIFKISQFALEE